MESITWESINKERQMVVACSHAREDLHECAGGRDRCGRLIDAYRACAIACEGVKCEMDALHIALNELGYREGDHHYIMAEVVDTIGRHAYLTFVIHRWDARKAARAIDTIIDGDGYLGEIAWQDGGRGFKRADYFIDGVCLASYDLDAYTD